MEIVDQMLSDALRLQRRIVTDILQPTVGGQANVHHGAAAAAAVVGSAGTAQQGSSVSLLLDVPYLEVLGFAVLPDKDQQTRDGGGYK